MSAASQIFADSALDREFRHQGCVVVPLLNRVEIDALLELYWATVPESIPDFYATIHDPDVDRQRRVSAEIEARVAPHVAALMPTYRTLMNTFIVKVGGTGRGRRSLHQDYTLGDHSAHIGVRLWCPLVDVDERNACLKVVPGSHALVSHIAAAPTASADQPDATTQRGRTGINPSPYDSVVDILEAQYLQSVPMAAGQAFLFDERLLHASGENTSPKIRVTVNGAYLPSGFQPRIYTWDPASPAKLDVLEFRDAFAIRFGFPLPHPYPEGVTRVGSLEYRYVPLTERQIEPLQSQGTAAATGGANGVPDSRGKAKGRSWISRILSQ